MPERRQRIVDKAGTGLPRRGDQRRHADADREPGGHRRALVRYARVQHGVQATLRHPAGLRAVGAWKQQRELLAVVARNQFPGALDAQAEDARHLTQALVAAQVAVVVVVVLEVVDVDHQQAQAGLRAGAALPLGLQAELELAPIRDADQAVRRGQPQLLLMGPLERQALLDQRRQIQPGHHQVAGRGARLLQVDPRAMVDVPLQRGAQRAPPSQPQGQPLLLATDRIGNLSGLQRAAHQGLVGLAKNRAFAAVGCQAGNLAVEADEPVLVVVDRDAGRHRIDDLPQAGFGRAQLMAQRIDLMLVVGQRGHELGTLGRAILTAGPAQAVPEGDTEPRTQGQQGRQGEQQGCRRVHSASLASDLAAAYRVSAEAPAAPGPPLRDGLVKFGAEVFDHVPIPPP
jgi:hypothetical protein